jgi:hypothetical protein
LGAVGSGDVGVAPGGPKAVHIREYRAETPPVLTKNRNPYRRWSVQRTGSTQMQAAETEHRRSFVDPTRYRCYT